MQLSFDIGKIIEWVMQVITTCYTYVFVHRSTHGGFYGRKIQLGHRVLQKNCSEDQRKADYSILFLQKDKF